MYDATPIKWWLGSLFAFCSLTAFAGATTSSGIADKAEHDEEDLHGWREISPGGETRCARDTPFAFFVNHGSDERVVIDFIGGGACWDAKSCSPEGATFTADLSSVREHAKNVTGVYDRANPLNPYRDWTHVIIPYCTGDIHWGNADVTYTKANGSQFTINHRGAINAQAVLAWVKKHYESPRDLLVTGCSAGSYGSIYWTPHIAEAFPKSRIRQFGDSGAGILTADFARRSASLWNITYAAPGWIPTLDPRTTDYDTLSLNEMYTRLAQHYPEIGFSQFNHVEDIIQQIFYARMGAEEPSEWRQRMLASMNSIATQAPNFRSFVGPGDYHCATIENTFYEEASSGILLHEWLRSYMSWQDVPHVLCDDCL